MGTQHSCTIFRLTCCCLSALTKKQLTTVARSNCSSISKNLMQHADDKKRDSYQCIYSILLSYSLCYYCFRTCGLRQCRYCYYFFFSRVNGHMTPLNALRGLSVVAILEELSFINKKNITFDLICV